MIGKISSLFSGHDRRRKDRRWKSCKSLPASCSITGVEQQGSSSKHVFIRSQSFGVLYISKCYYDKMGGSDKIGMQFYYALRHRKLNRVKNLVLNHGVSVNLMFADGSFPIHIAAEQADNPTLDFLLSLRAKPDYVNQHGQTALMVGIMFPDIVMTLVNFKCGVNRTDSQRRTALHLACAQGLPLVVSSLLVAGARFSVRDRWGRTPLHVTLLNMPHGQAETVKYTKCVKLLLHRKANVNCTDNQHSTPLFLAVNGHQTEVVDLLISHGAYINQNSRNNLTALALAVLKGFEDICKLLLSHGADINPDWSGAEKSCFHLAVSKGHVSIVHLLATAGCKYYTEPWLFARVISWMKGDTEMNELLQHLLDKPPCLKQLSRGVIRQQLGCRVQSAVPKLDYPPLLKNYLLLHDVL